MVDSAFKRDCRAAVGVPPRKGVDLRLRWKVLLKTYQAPFTPTTCTEILNVTERSTCSTRRASLSIRRPFPSLFIETPPSLSGIQTHYDNPNGVEGEEDNSGVRVYYTEELRPIDAGVIELGDPFIALYGQALEDGKSRYSFTCPSSCFETYFEVKHPRSFHARKKRCRGERFVY